MEKDRKPLDPAANPDFKGDLPDEIDLWFADAIEFDDLTEAGKKAVLEIIKGGSDD